MPILSLEGGWQSKPGWILNSTPGSCAPKKSLQVSGRIGQRSLVKISQFKWITLVYLAGLLLGGALLFAWVSTGFSGVTGLLAWMGVLLLAGLVLAGGLFLLRGLPVPRWLVALTIAAALLRLFAGAAWLILLPAFGYDTDVQNAGYMMEDAFRRDAASWDLAQSGQPLWAAFVETEQGNYRNVDQYGGLLFLSAAIYRFLGGSQHQPLQVVAVAAAFSALAGPLGWAIGRRLFSDRTARWAAWGLALYPEAVLLGSSQMREAFMITLAAAAFYGLIMYWDAVHSGPAGSRAGLAWLVVPFLLSLPLSPPLAGILLGLLILFGLALADWKLLKNVRLWGVLGLILALVLAALWIGWDQIAPRLHAEQFANPLAMVSRWAELSARWQATLTRNSSGWLQKIFDSTPEWMNLPFLIGYGIARPFLPAQLTAWSIPVWWGVGLWRSLGWTILLLLLLYAPIRAWRTAENRNILLGLSLVVWAGILIAAFWGGGDQWDNPRYRVSFAVLQVLLAAWAAVAQLEKPDPWMRRVLVAALGVPAWFIPWYLRRYTRFDQIFGWEVVDIFKILGLGVLTGVLYMIWDWAGSQKKPDDEHSL
jgi:hypothetical protein